MKLILVLIFGLSFANCLVFDCSFYSVSWYTSGNFNTCYLTVINTGNPLILEEVRGENKAGSVEALSANGQTLERFPTNFASFFPKLKIISCVNSKLIKISAADLKPFVNLMYLNLARNQLIELDGDLLKFTPQLQGVIFQRNQLKEVGKNLLKGLNVLRFADFQYNPCINGFVQNGGFSSLSSELSRKCPQVDKIINETISLRCSLANENDELQLNVKFLFEEFENLKFELLELNAGMIKGKLQKVV